MRPLCVGCWLAVLLLGTALSGCKSTAASHYPADPLFVTKKPVEVKPENVRPAKVAAAQFVAPPLRLDAVASRGGRSPGRTTTAEPPVSPPSRPADENQRDVTPAAHRADAGIPNAVVRGSGS